MADKQSGLLVTLGKRLLGFSTSSSGCCASSTTEEAKQPETLTLPAKVIDVLARDPTAVGGSCCAPSCCSAETPADAKRA
jgi:hypothetical protein